MDWLRHNPIADMYGPYFLLFYAVVIGITLVSCWYALWAADSSGALPPPQIPVQPDPYEIAFLRGGANEVTRLAIFALVQRGYLEIKQEPKKFWQNAKPQQIVQAPGAGPLAGLSPGERVAFDWFSRPRRADEVFGPGGVAAAVQTRCEPYERQLRSDKLLMPPEMRSFVRQIRLAGTVVIIGLGGYKLWDAWLEGRSNVWFLIIMAAVSLPLLSHVCKVPRLSRRGRAYLLRLRLAFARLKHQAPALTMSSATTNPSTAPHGPAAGSFDPVLLMVGVFGVAALSGTAYAYYPQMFNRGTTDAGGGGCGGGGCGSSGGSSGCGGGGCGGGGCGGG